MRNTFTLLAGLLLGLFVISLADAQQSDGIPKKAMKEHDFMAGKWQADMYEDGEKVGTAAGERKSSPGKYCLLFSSTLDLHGTEFEAAGISGWTRKGRAIFEHWYASNGASLTVRYPLAKMKGNVWEGTHHLIQPDGTERMGPCKLEKGDATNGLAMFKKHCAACHVHGEIGSEIGPNLTGMSVHPKEEILINVLDPSRSVENNFRT